MESRSPQSGSGEPGKPELPEFVGTAEIREMLKISRRRFHKLCNQSGFPAPAAVLAGGRVWISADVMAWIRVNRPADLP